MTGLAISLILISAFCHAFWNYLAKKACGGTAFIWLFASMSALLYCPLAIWILITQKIQLGLYPLLFILGSAVLHSVYFILLDKGYSVGDLSIIYPLARGTGPLLATLTAIILLGERPTPLALLGAVFIAIGIVVITGNPLMLKDPASRKPIMFAVLCGATISCYTVLDKVAVSTLLIPPLLLDWCTNFGRVLLLTPYSIKNWDKVREQWSNHKKHAIGVAILSPLAYILVLTAMVFTPVSYVASAREISILIGSFMGAKLLAEGNYKIRIAGACAMLLGLCGLSFG